MRYPTGHKQETRARILGTAGRVFRSKGYAATGVAQVMKACGLTVGGFYKHFDSKETLLGEVLAAAVRATHAKLFSGLEGLDARGRAREIARRYLSRAHRDAAGDGCPAPALAAEVARLGDAAREPFDRELRRLLARLAVQLGPDPRRGLDAEEHALAFASQLVGGMLLARATGDAELSDRILLAGRRFLARPREDPTEEAP